jgi:hypothetical protein
VQEPFPRAYGKTIEGYRVVVVDHGPHGYHGTRFWLRFYIHPWGFWSDSSETWRGIMGKIKEDLVKARREK